MGSEVVGGFAVLGVVEAFDLGFFRDAEAAADDFGDAEGDGGCGTAPEDGDDDGFGLDPELGTDGAGFAALAAEGFRAEDAGEEGTDDAADTVDAEDVERVVVTEGVLEFGGAEVAEDAGGGSDGDGAHGSAGAAGGGDGDEAGDRSGGDADGGGFAADDPLKSMAMPAEPLAARALPALKPNQPTQRSPAPMTAKGTWCGCMADWPKPRRFPTARQPTRPAMAALMWTTVPPAKSSTPQPMKRPLALQAMCQTGR